MQLRVVKCDGSEELYLHTKVLGTVAAALADAGDLEINVAEELAEAVTTFVRKKYGSARVNAGEVHSMIMVVLSETGFESAALRLHEHRTQRQLQRNRVRVLYEAAPAGGAEAGGRRGEGEYLAVPWNKSEVVKDLEERQSLARPTARTVAAVVEEKILGLGRRYVTAGLVREMVFNELLTMRRATESLSASGQDDERPAAARVAGARSPVAV